MATVAVTGSASGIGKATCLRLAGRGDRVIGVDLRDADVLADLATPEGREAAVRGVLDRCDGRLDRLVLAAGISGVSTAPSLVARINYFGVLDVMNPLRAALEAGESASCVVVCSDSATYGDYRAMPYVQALLDHDEAKACLLADDAKHSFLAYGPGKYALGVAVRQRVAEWGAAGVRLNAVAPGPIETPMLDGVKEKFADALSAAVAPLGRNGLPEEIAALIAFLLSPDAGYLHGAFIYADGGGEALRRPETF